MAVEKIGMGTKPDPSTFEILELEGHPVIARFIPTEEGQALARICAKLYIK